MANVLTVPASGALFFDNTAAGGSTVPSLATNAVAICHDAGGGITINSSASATDRFKVTGSEGTLFCVSDVSSGTIEVGGDTTIQGSLSVHGDMHYIDTLVTVTSAMSVINTGTGPALYVEQEGSEPIAQFIDREGGEIHFADSGDVGIGTASPAEKLEVDGAIVSTAPLTTGVYPGVSLSYENYVGIQGV